MILKTFTKSLHILVKLLPNLRGVASTYVEQITKMNEEQFNKCQNREILCRFGLQARNQSDGICCIKGEYSPLLS